MQVDPRGSEQGTQIQGMQEVRNEVGFLMEQRQVGCRQIKGVLGETQACDRFIRTSKCSNECWEAGVLGCHWEIGQMALEEPGPGQRAGVMCLLLLGQRARKAEQKGAWIV